MSSYVLSKWAVHGLVRTLQVETRAPGRRRGVARRPPEASTPPSTGRRRPSSGGTAHPPPPVGTAEDVARRVCVRVLRRPRRQTHVGPANPVVVAGFRLFPAVYDALVTPMLRTFALDAVARHPADDRQRRRSPGAPVAQPRGAMPAPSRPTEPPDAPPEEPRHDRRDRTRAAGTPSTARGLAIGRRPGRGGVGRALRRVAVRHVGGRRLPGARGRPRLAAARARGCTTASACGRPLISDSTVSEESEEPRHLVLTAPGLAAGGGHGSRSRSCPTAPRAARCRSPRTPRGSRPTRARCPCGSSSSCRATGRRCAGWPDGRGPSPGVARRRTAGAPAPRLELAHAARRDQAVRTSARRTAPERAAMAQGRDGGVPATGTVHPPPGWAEALAR